VFGLERISARPTVDRPIGRPAGIDFAPSPRRRDLAGSGRLRPNFLFENVTLVGRERGRRRTFFDGVVGALPRGRNAAVLCSDPAAAEALVRMLTGMERPNSGKLARNVRMSWPMRFAGYLMTEATLRENSLFIARLYGEDTRAVAAFIRDVMAIGPEFDKTLSEVSQDLKRKLAMTMALAVEFECYILDGTMTVRDEAFIERWTAALHERLRTADIVQISNKKRGLLDGHEMGATVEEGRLRIFDTVEAAIDAFHEHEGRAMDLDDTTTLPDSGDGEEGL